MNGPTPAGRPLTAPEVDVIRGALLRAAEIPNAAALLPALEGLLVVGGCDCGCPSVDFEVGGQASPWGLIADGVGRTSAGRTVGVIVWGAADRVTGLEIYELDGKEGNRQMPIPDSIAPFPGPPVGT